MLIISVHLLLPLDYPEPECKIIILDLPFVLETQIGVAHRAVMDIIHDIHM
jgi:hypothetical protein